MMQHSDTNCKYVAEITYSDTANCFGFSHCFNQFKGDKESLTKILNEIYNLELAIKELENDEPDPAA